MANHSQKADRTHTVCSPCKRDECDKCVDVLRALYTDTRLCGCRKMGHEGEPRAAQVLDPETGAVYGPGVVVGQNGEVTKR